MADYRIRLGSLSWGQQAGLILFTALGIAVALALILLSAGLAIILLPVAAVAVLLGRWRLKRLMAEAARREAERRQAARTIEIDYRVLGDD